MKKHLQHYLGLLITTFLFIGCSNSTFEDIEADAEPLPDVVTYAEV